MRIAVAVTLLVLPLLVHAAERIEVVGNDFVDFGKYPAHERQTATFMLRNTGDAPLRIIQVRKSCGCAVASCDPMLVQPAQPARVEVAILPDSLAGSYSKNLFVESSDPANRFLRLNVSGEAVPLVAVLPEGLAYLGRLPTNAPVSRSFTLTPADPAVRLGTLTVEGSKDLSAKLSSPNGPSNRPSYRLDVALGPCPTAGEVRGTVLVPILLPTNQPPVRIEVSARIGGELLLVPASIQLARSEVAVTRELSVQIIGANGIQAEQVVPPVHPGIAFEVRSTDDPRRFAIRATCKAAFLKEVADRGQVQLTFSLPGCTPATLAFSLAP